MTTAKREQRTAFTLIEMMVVVAIIGILIAGVFRLMGAAGESTKKAETVARLQKLQNALSGFYAEYGTYPPVRQHGSPDPLDKTNADNGNVEKAGSLAAGDHNGAAACQPIGFEYPNRASLDDFINTRFQPDGIRSVNQQLGPTAGSPTLGSEWPATKIFKFGLLSYLLPRVELMGGEDTVKGSGDTPDMNFFASAQWKKNNTGSLTSLRARENAAVARWLPNFESSLYGGYTLMGINTAEPGHGGPHFTGVNQYPNGKNGGNKYVLVGITIRDGWGSGLYYYSAPPYQSYRVWSAGPNGQTFPPWVSLESLSVSDRKMVTTWVEDDVIRFDR